MAEVYDFIDPHRAPTVDCMGRLHRSKPVAERLAQHYTERDDGCWLWTAFTDRDGYGRVQIAGKKWFAHRAMYVLHVGRIPAGLQLDHLCRVRNCVNPRHLEPVSPRENSIRGTGISAVNGRKTHCIRGHEFTPENTYIWGPARSHRSCRACAGLRASAAKTDGAA